MIPEPAVRQQLSIGRILLIVGAVLFGGMLLACCVCGGIIAQLPDLFTPMTIS